MAEGIKPIRRVVTGNDSNGRSRVLYDSAAPRVKASAFKKGTGMTDIWMFDSSPAPLSGDRDDGDLPFHFEPPDNGGRLRIVQSDSRPAVYDASKDEHITPEHPPKKTEGGTWERGRQNLYRTRIHKSETLDYGIVSDRRAHPRHRRRRAASPARRRLRPDRKLACLAGDGGREPDGFHHDGRQV